MNEIWRQCKLQQMMNKLSQWLQKQKMQTGMEDAHNQTDLMNKGHSHGK
jgi:hypothetical protein